MPSVVKPSLNERPERSPRIVFKHKKATHTPVIKPKKDAS